MQFNSNWRIRIWLAISLLFAAANLGSAETNPKTIGWRDLLQLDYKTGSMPLPLKSINGAIVKIPGFAVPVVGEGRMIREFLLVPTFGACIHVPPPPPNQIVYVSLRKPIDVETLYGAVWVTGNLRIESTMSQYAEASYLMEGQGVVSYSPGG